MCLPLGMTGLAEAPREPAVQALAPGDVVLSCTDGVSGRSKTGRFCPLASRVLPGTRAPGTVLDYLCGDVQRHCSHPLDDDAAMLMISHVH